MNLILFALLGVDTVGTVLGIYAMKSRALSGKFTAISAGVMIGVALFWIFPDMTLKSGTAPAALAVGGALTALCAIDRYIYPVCPCCAHGKRPSPPARFHHSRTSGTNGALIPLVIAICIHNLFDGWTAVAAGHAGSGPGSGMAVGLIAHKIPEAVVFGLMLRNATKVRNVQILSVGFTSLAILAGGAAHSGFWMLSETIVIAASLALACSSFLFAGGHMFLRQQRHAGIRSAVAPLIIGVLFSAAVERAISTALAQ
jgi:zinc transporter ZupT